MANLTERDREVLNLAWQCFKTAPEIDYTKLTSLAGYANPSSATACLLAAKKKVLTTKGTSATARDHEIVTLAWQCFKKVPAVDYAKLCEVAGYKNKSSAAACFGSAKRKVAGGKGGSPGGGERGKKGSGGTGVSEEDAGKRRVAMERNEAEAEEAEVDVRPVSSEEEGVDENLFATAQQYLDEQEESGQALAEDEHSDLINWDA